MGTKEGSPGKTGGDNNSSTGSFQGDGEPPAPSVIFMGCWSPGC